MILHQGGALTVEDTDLTVDTFTMPASKVTVSAA